MSNICRNTEKADVSKMHNREKVKIKSMLEEALCRICFIINLWTSINFHCCANKVLKKNYLDSKFIFIVMWIRYWEKVFSLIVDIASNDDVYVVVLKVNWDKGMIWCVMGISFVFDVVLILLILLLKKDLTKLSKK